jgi:hypothetical protein
MKTKNILAAIGIPAVLNAQRASRDTARLKAVEGVRNAAASVYTKTNAINCWPTVTQPGGSGTAISVTQGTGGVCPAAGAGLNVEQVDGAAASNGGYALTRLAGATCTASSGNVANFLYNAGTFTLCRENGGQDVLPIQ